MLMHESLIDSAFEFAYPLYAVAQTRYRAVQDPSNPRRHAPNTLQHERALSDHTSRWITAPNNDTLYSNAWLDLSQGPVRVRAAPMPEGRYWSIAFMDAFTNNFAVHGQRREGRGPVDVVLVGPRDRAAGVPGRSIQAPGDDVWMFCRSLVEGPQDLQNSHAMQDRLDVLPPAGKSYPPRVVPTRSADPANFLAVINESLARNPVPPSEAVLLDGWAEIGLRPGAMEAWRELPDDVRAAWNGRIGAVHDNLRRASASGRREIQGWFASATDMGNFGTNYPLRASVALGGLGALGPDEAMYFVRFHDDAGQLLDGRNHYRLHVPAGGIPTGSFWSFSMYEPTADSQRFFVENPIRRYSIGNRTPGLVPHPDGSLDIALQHDAPHDAVLRANWLPAPAGPFQISLRAYLPRAELRELRAVMPAIVRT
jgi:hypothetical protein